MFYKKGVLTCLEKFTGKQLGQSLFFVFIKKETLAQVLSYEFCETFKSTFFTEHLQATASTWSQILLKIILQKSYILIFRELQLHTLNI